MNRVRPGLVLNQKLRGYNKVELTQHALGRMRQRNITREDVFSAVEHPDLENLPTTPERQRVRWNKSVNYSIDVIFEEHEEFIRIVTAMRVTDVFEGMAPEIRRAWKTAPKPKQKKRKKR